MSARGPYERVPALCNECGEQRKVAFRTANTAAWYKCAHCHRRTLHAIVAPPGWDYREKENEESGSALLNEYRYLVEFMQLAGFQIRYGQLRRGIHASVIQYYGNEGLDIDVTLADGLTLQEEVNLLRWAWTIFLDPRVQAWRVRSDGDQEWKGVDRTCGNCEEGRPCRGRVTEAADV